MTGLYLIIIFFCAQLMDVMTTYIAINSLGFIEYNPVAETLFQKIGMLEVLLIKLLLAIIFIAVYYFAWVKKNRAHWSLEKSMQITSISTWLVAIWNMTGIASVTFLRFGF